MYPSQSVHWQMKLHTNMGWHIEANKCEEVWIKDDGGTWRSGPDRGRREEPTKKIFKWAT